jgi:3-dehydroquinate synthase
MEKVKVELGARSYDILIGSGVLNELGGQCRKLGFAGKCAVVTDYNVGKFYANTVISGLKDYGFDPLLIKLRPGERTKSFVTAEHCFNTLAKHRIGRDSFIVALGGGVVGDLAGFLAATYLRGISFIQVPTSLLAQVDSSVGGKVAVNLECGKNLVGAFYQPRLVICDVETLKTLSQREYNSGLAEVIKYGVIWDEKFFKRLELKSEEIKGKDLKELSGIIRRCCEIKAEVVSRDEKESGLRAILNFGHTLGHAVEAVFGYGKVLHGEAISIGMVFAGYLSGAVLDFPKEHLQRLISLIKRFGLPIGFDRLYNKKLVNALIKTMELDKKSVSGQFRLVLVRRIGEVEYGCKLDRLVIESEIKNLFKV